MAYERRDFAGGAIETVLSGGITSTATTININDATGWPTGADGKFFVVIDPPVNGVPNSATEKIKVLSRSGTTLTLSSSADRGQDGTAAAAHNAGAVIFHCVTATDLDEANAHIADTTLDHHSQYLNLARHSNPAIHLIGTQLPTPGTPADVGTSSTSGSGTAPARDDHGHKLGPASVGTSNYAPLSIDTAALGNGIVTLEKVAGSVLPPGLTFDYAGTGPVPSGWLECDGTAISRSVYSGLFSAIGTTYGVGDGVSTFNLPNAKGRVIVGQDTAQTEFDVISETGGAKAHTLAEGEIPAHTHAPGTLAAAGGGHEHTLDAINDSQGATTIANRFSLAAAATPVANMTNADGDHGHTFSGVTAATGGGTAHNNLQPYIVMRKIIKT